ncbi:FYVE, RhoGEF and PH domain-containing protein 3-like isoform X1 [Petromyzon marinus]|uniref:FYVE, RhoGEF and PH domain-containing protein 3-like isoform X1 n=3 Tax=Petromyzon marinus TaxID=7757 RepID=UPI003F6FA96B
MQPESAARSLAMNGREDASVSAKGRRRRHALRKECNGVPPVTSVRSPLGCVSDESGATKATVASQPSQAAQARTGRTQGVAAATPDRAPRAKPQVPPKPAAFQRSSPPPDEPPPRVIPPPPNRPLPPDPRQRMESQSKESSTVMQLINKFGGASPNIQRRNPAPDKGDMAAAAAAAAVTTTSAVSAGERRDSCRTDSDSETGPGTTAAAMPTPRDAARKDADDEKACVRGKDDANLDEEEEEEDSSSSGAATATAATAAGAPGAGPGGFGPGKIPNRDSGIESLSSAFPADDADSREGVDDVRDDDRDCQCGVRSEAVPPAPGETGGAAERRKLARDSRRRETLEEFESDLEEGSSDDNAEPTRHAAPELGGDSQTAEPPKEKLYKIADELLQTERAYVTRLHLLDKVFCARLLEESCIKSTFPADVVTGIFSNTSTIHMFHQEFLLPELEKRMQEWHENPRIGDVLQKLAPFLKMYGEYVKNFDRAMDLLNTWMEKSSPFKAIIQEIQKRDICHNLTLQHHMLEPVQRIPRYELLLRDYLKRLPEDAVDRKDAEKSLEIISTAANHSNAAIRKMEKMHKLLEVYEMLDGEEDIVHPSNELIKEGQILKLSAKNGTAQERHLFLFNNMLLYCVPKLRLMGQQRFSVRTRLNIDGMQLQEVESQGQPYTFSVSGKQRALVIRARSEAEKKEWVKAIRDTIEKHEKNSESFKAFNSSFNSSFTRDDDGEFSATELGRRAPHLVRERSVSECMSCSEPFNALTRRKHHCRACGHVVCGKCSEYKAQLEYEGGKLARVCHDCYGVLRPQQQQQHETEELPDDVRRARVAAVAERRASADPAGSILCGFLSLSERGVKASHRAWFTVPRSEPLVLYMYETAKDAKPMRTIPLPGYAISPLEASDPHEARHAFKMTQSRQTLYFGTDGEESQRRWMGYLALAAIGEVPSCPPSPSVISKQVSIPEEGAEQNDESSAQSDSILDTSAS